MRTPSASHIWLSDVTTIEYVRNALKRVRKKESSLILAGQNLEDFDVDGIRQLCLNIPILFFMNRFFGMNGIVWTQLTADFINVVISYVIYTRLIGHSASS